MKVWKYNNRGLGVFLALAITVHLVFILVPLTKKISEPLTEHRSVKIRLLSPPQVVEQPQATEPLVEWKEPETPRLEELPPAPVTEHQLSVQEIVQQPPPTSTRVLSSQFDYENAVQESLFGSVEMKKDSPDFYIRQQTSLEMVLNQPSLQLPFADTRIYLVENYDDGILGRIDKFWDTVSVPFGFTTKNNTRVQCVWVLVFAGCGWGHKTLFYRPARHREKPKEPLVENT
jgi:hypothetical protein